MAQVGAKISTKANDLEPELHLDETMIGKLRKSKDKVKAVVLPDLSSYIHGNESTEKEKEVPDAGSTVGNET